MPAKRKSIEALTLSGAIRKNPARYRGRADAPANLPALGYPPRAFSPDEKAAWRAIVRTAPAGLLTAADELVIELASRLIVRVRTSSAPKASEVTVLLQILGRLGLTPDDRARLNITLLPVPVPHDPWAAFDAFVIPGSAGE